jgi:hypothetical protein
VKRYLGLLVGAWFSHAASAQLIFLPSADPTASLAAGSPALNNASLSGIENSAFGNQVLVSDTTGSRNTGVGYKSLYSATTGSQNAAFGVAALENDTTGGNNTAIGSFSLWTCTICNNNVAVGVVDAVVKHGRLERSHRLRRADQKHHGLVERCYRC